MKVNEEIRKAMHDKRVPAWMLADAEQVHENTVLRRLRHELPDEEKRRVLTVIDRIAAEKAVNAHG